MKKDKVAIVGLWHLGLVTSISLAKLGYDVTAFDEDKELICRLQLNKIPFHEKNIRPFLIRFKKNIKFENNFKKLKNFSKVWICYDTPINKNNLPNSNVIKRNILKISKHLKQGSTLIISTQVPLGFTKMIKKLIKKKISISYSPENLRLGNSFKSFLKPDRIIVGVDELSNKIKLFSFFSKISKNILFVKNSSAELIKHAINAYLATSIAFSNEIGYLCERFGANPNELVNGLRTEKRIGKKAYVRPGEAFSGGTLARDLKYLIRLSNSKNLINYIFKSVLISNNHHKNWIYEKIKFLKQNKKIYDNDNILFLGLSYKENSNILRDSNTKLLINKLKKLKLNIIVFDKNLKNKVNNNYLLLSNLYKALTVSKVIISHNEIKIMNSIKKVNLNNKIIIDYSGSLNFLSKFKDYYRFGLK